MFWWGSARVVEWLAHVGATMSPDGTWAYGARSNLTANDLIHEIDEAVRNDPGLTPDEKLALRFGMLDYFDDYAVAMYLTFEFDGPDSPHYGALDRVWQFCREMLDREANPDAVAYWLWVDWFEDPATSSLSFTEVTSGLDELSDDSSSGVIRRFDRVLRVSGPVPWHVKAPAYEAALLIPGLRDSLREAIAASGSDMYGKIDELAANALLLRLAEWETA